VRSKPYEIDLHGLTREDAEFNLRLFFENIPPSVRQVYVIHGIGGGVLKKLCAEFWHERIIERAVCVSNPGQTVYYLN
jgi:DNA-nicking Smr family endonuclease